MTIHINILVAVVTEADASFLHFVISYYHLMFQCILTEIKQQRDRKGQACLCQPTFWGTRPTFPPPSLDLGASLIWGPAQGLSWLGRISVAFGPATHGLALG